jgi:ubiquinone/menaquinone biosynthesis C-methylase UbiE
MLKQCQRKTGNAGGRSSLVSGSAEHLPFRDSLFDAVFHATGINFVNDKGGAIREMIRVAKAGTRIVIVDEGGKSSRATTSASPSPKAAPWREGCRSRWRCTAHPPT